MKPTISINAAPGSQSKILGLTADWHLSPSHFHRRSRGEDFCRAARSCIEAAHRRKCGALLVGGDTLHTASNQPAVLVQLLELDNYARDYELPILIIDGNHDRMQPSWFEVLQDFRMKTPGAMTARLQGGFIPINHTRVEIRWPDASTVTVLGVPAGSLDELNQSVSENPPADVLLWHEAIQELMGFPDPARPALADLPTNRFRMVALGDIHTDFNYTTVGQCVVGYPGSTELYKRDDSLEHSMTVVDLNVTPVTTERVPIQHRKALTYRIETEDSLQFVIDEVRKHEAEAPVVLIRYNPKLGDVLARLYTALDPQKFLIRPAPIEPEVLGDWFNHQDQPLEGKPVTAFIPEFLDAGSELAKLAALLCDPDAEHALLIDNYVQDSLAA